MWSFSSFVRLKRKNPIAPLIDLKIVTLLLRLLLLLACKFHLCMRLQYSRLLAQCPTECIGFHSFGLLAHLSPYCQFGTGFHVPVPDALTNKGLVEFNFVGYSPMSVDQ